MSAALSFEQAPPISVPYRFFVTGPPFGVAAGLLLALEWEAVTASRWALPTFAVVHLVTAGFMLQVMCGAMLQFLPVAAGANVWRPRLVAAVVHPSLTLGAVALVAGFLGAGRWALHAAAGLLAMGLAVFVAVTAVGLARSPAIGPTLQVLRGAVFGLAVTAGLGVALALALGGVVTVPLVELAHLHGAFGLGGWALLLVMAVAYLVVPMFQLTPPYPVRFARAVPLVVGAGLLAWTVGVLLALPALEWLGLALGAAALVAFAGKTLSLQRQRKRKVRDTTFYAWRVGLVSLLVAGAALLAVRLAPHGVVRERLEYLAGAALLAGAFPALMAGMLYKIVGFIDWLHLQRVMADPPLMQHVLPDARARWQWRVFTASLVLLFGAALWPPLAVAGGLAFAAACGLLEWHLAQAIALYRRLARAAAADPARQARDIPGRP